MPFGSYTIGDSKQNRKELIVQPGNFVASYPFRIDYDSTHASPGFQDNGVMPIVFTRIEALVNGGTMRFAIWNAKGKKNKPKPLARTGDISGGGGAQDGTRTLKKGNVNWLGRTDQRFQVGIIYRGGGFVGLTSTDTTFGQYYEYNSSWKALAKSNDPFYAKVYYNTVPTQPVSASLTASLTPSNSMQLSWGRPANDGGDTVDGYRIQWSTDSQFDIIKGEVYDTKSRSTTYLITKLNSATTYYVRVAALNGVSAQFGGGHSSPWSDSTSAATSAGPDVEQLRNNVAEANYLKLRRYESMYGVQDSEGHVIPNKQWLSYGGSVTCDVAAPGQLALTLTGPRTDIPGYPPPYTLAIRDEDGGDSPALTIRGWGVTSEPRDIFLPTGASPNLIGIEELRAVENVSLGNRDLTYGRSTLVLREHSGNNSTLNFTISGDAATKFLPGTTFSYDSAVWRVMSADIANATATVTASLFTTAEALDAAWVGKTLDQQDAAWADRVVDDLALKPLYAAP